MEKEIKLKVYILKRLTLKCRASLLCGLANYEEK